MNPTYSCNKVESGVLLSASGPYYTAFGYNPDIIKTWAVIIRSLTADGLVFKQKLYEVLRSDTFTKMQPSPPAFSRGIYQGPDIKIMINCGVVGMFSCVVSLTETEAKLPDEHKRIQIVDLVLTNESEMIIVDISKETPKVTIQEPKKDTRGNTMVGLDTTEDLRSTRSSSRKSPARDTSSSNYRERKNAENTKYLDNLSMRIDDLSDRVDKLEKPKRRSTRRRTDSVD